jgi:uncharacterized protein
MLRAFEHRQIFHPDRFMMFTGAELGRPFEDVFFSTSDGLQLNGWFFPCTPGSPRAHLALLYCHGNGGNIGYRLDACAAVLETGVNLFIFDYRGYGRSAGRPSEAGTYLDAQAAYHWLRNRGFAGSNIIAYGESLGGGVVSELGLREPLGGLVLQSTFTSIRDIGAEVFPWLPVRWLASNTYDTRSKLPRLHIPILVMHSRADGLARFHHAERNFAAANPPKWFCELEGDHNHPLTNRAKFIGGLEEFIGTIQ